MSTSTTCPDSQTLQPPEEAPTPNIKLLQNIELLGKTKEQADKQQQPKEPEETVIAENQRREPPKTVAQRKIYVWESDSKEELEKQKRPPTPGREIN